MKSKSGQCTRDMSELVNLPTDLANLDIHIDPVVSVYIQYTFML